MGLDGWDIRIIANLRWNQKVDIRINGQTCRSAYYERRNFFREAIEDRTEGIIFNGIIINNLRYVDDTVLLATDKDDLQALLAAVTDQTDLRLNVKKTKLSAKTKVYRQSDNISINGEIGKGV